MKSNYKSEYQSSIDMKMGESQIQWERYNAMLVINTILLGLIGFTFSEEFSIPYLIKIILPPSGILLCTLWFFMTSRGFLWTKFWTEEGRKFESTSRRKHLNPLIDGEQYRKEHKSWINTEIASKIIILIFIFIYSVIFYAYLPSENSLNINLDINNLLKFAFLGLLEGIFLFTFKSEIFDYNTELGFNTIAKKEVNGKIMDFLKDKRISHSSAPLVSKIWRFLSIEIGTVLGWIMLWLLIDKRLDYFSNTSISWEDFALFLLAYIGISGRLSTIPESVQQWFRR